MNVRELIPWGRNGNQTPATYGDGGGNPFLALQREVNRLFDLYEARLGSSAFVGGDAYGIADMAAFPWLRNHELLGVSMTERPHLVRYVETVAARPAVQRALAKVGGIQSARDTATDDNKDRLFGRGKYARAGGRRVRLPEKRLGRQ